jgi:hypothetical protein
MTLPSVTGERLDALRARATDLADQAAAARQRLAAIADRRHILASNGVHTMGIAAAAAEDEKLCAEIPALRDTCDEAEAAAQLARKAQAFCAAPPSGPWAAATLPRLKRLKDESWAEAVERIRHELTALETEARRVRDAPPSRDELRERLEGRVRALAAEGTPIISPEGLVQSQSRNALATLAWAMPQTLLKALERDIPATGGLPAAARKARLEQLAGQRHGLELQEESLIRASEADGQAVARRADAPVEIALGLVRAEAEAAVERAA